MYDDTYQSRQCLSENAVVQSLIRDLAVRHRPVTITDFGAGTGLFLDLFPDYCDRTINIDPSLGMLSRLSEKHPKATCVHGDHTFDPSNVVAPADLVVSLFESLSYVPREDVPGLIKRLTLKAAFLMFASPHGAAGKVFGESPEAAADRAIKQRWSVEDLEDLAVEVGATSFAAFMLNTYSVLILEVEGG